LVKALADPPPQLGQAFLDSHGQCALLRLKTLRQLRLCCGLALSHLGQPTFERG
jgi:hypothetical protein